MPKTNNSDWAAELGLGSKLADKPRMDTPTRILRGERFGKRRIYPMLPSALSAIATRSGKLAPKADKDWSAARKCLHAVVAKRISPYIGHRKARLTSFSAAQIKAAWKKADDAGIVDSTQPAE